MMKIMINNDPWDVRFISGKKKKMNVSDDLIYSGLTEYMKLVINIRKGMPKTITRCTVIHELVHAFIHSYGLTVESEESMCEFFGAFGDQIMKLTDTIMERWEENADYK